LAKQIHPVTREQLLAGYKEFQVIRKLPEEEYRIVFKVLKAYHETSDGKQLGIEFL
jgi:hypothetical protein